MALCIKYVTSGNKSGEKIALFDLLREVKKEMGPIEE
jgi:hypothetical protein